MSSERPLPFFMLVERGRQLLASGRLSEAESSYRRALAQQPDNGPIHAMLALTLHSQEKPAESHREAREAVRLAPESALCQQMLAVAELKQDNLDEAELAIRTALRLEPRDLASHVIASEVCLARGQWDPAAEHARSGLRIDPTDESCLRLLAQAESGRGRKDEFVPGIGSVLNREPDESSYQAAAGWAFLMAGAPLDALGAYLAALRPAPADPGSQDDQAAPPAPRWMENILDWLGNSFWAVGPLLAVALLGAVVGAIAGEARPGLAVTMTWVARAGLLLALSPLLLLAASYLALSYWPRAVRRALPRELNLFSGWIAGCLLAALLLAGAGLLVELLALQGWVAPPETALGLTPRHNALLQASLKTLVLMAFGVAAYLIRQRVVRVLLAVLTGGLALLIVASLACSLTGRPPDNYDVGFWAIPVLLIAGAGYVLERKAKLRS